MIDALTKFLVRIGHLWIENPLTALLFVPRLMPPLELELSDIGSRRIGEVFGRHGRQLQQAFMRGIIIVLALTVAIAAGMTAVMARVGEEIRPLFDLVILVVLVRDVLPLVLALILAARAGGTIAAKFATMPALRGLRVPRFGDRAIQLLALPQITASILTAGAFYVVLAVGVLASYIAGGEPSRWVFLDIPDYIRLYSYGTPLITGLVKSMMFGGVIALCAVALGIDTAERYVPEDNATHDVHFAVWESTVTALMLCVAVSFAVWHSL